MAQTYTSAGTSVNRSKLPAVFRKAHFSAGIVMDYGCGKYTDHIKAFVNSQHKTYLPFDPYNQPDDRNCTTASIVANAMYARYPVDVVCSNVLNVIDDDNTIRKIVNHITEIVDTTNGTAYFTAYEGDRSGIGRRTGADQFQRNEPLRDYLRFFRSNAVLRNGMIILLGR